MLIYIMLVWERERLKNDCSNETTLHGEWNHLPLKQLSACVVWMKQKAKRRTEELVLDWTKQGRNPENNQLTS